MSLRIATHRFIQLFLIIIQASYCYSQSPQWSWAKSINTSDHELINALGVDKSNNDVYAVREWRGGIDHKGRELLPDTYYYVLTIPSERVVRSFIEIRR